MNRVMIALGVLIVLANSVIVGCGKSKEKTIVGKWKEVGGTQTIEFFKDGTVTVVDKGESPLNGDYKFIDKNRIRMNLALFGPITVEISPSLDEITLTNPFGKVEKYRRLEDKTQVKKGAALVLPKRISGKYVNQSEEDEYLEFRSDGTFASSKPPHGFGREFIGEWRVATIISFVFRNHRGEPTEHDSIEGEIMGDTFLVEGRSFGRWWNESSRKNITPWIRKGNAPLIKTINQDNNIWSMYSNEDWLFEFQLKKDRTFSISAKGIWELERNIVRLRDPAREGKVFRTQIDEYNTLGFLIYLRGAVFEKQNSAHIIEKTPGKYVNQEGALWSRYVRGEDENIVLEFDKNGSFRMTGSGIWMTYTGLICEDNYRQWRAIVRDGTLIDRRHQMWTKQ